MKASRSPLIGRVLKSDAHRTAFGFASEYFKGARLHGVYFRQGVDSNRENRQVGEVDRSTNGEVYFRRNFAITTTVRNGSKAALSTLEAVSSGVRRIAELIQDRGLDTVTTALGQKQTMVVGAPNYSQSAKNQA